MSTSAPFLRKRRRIRPTLVEIEFEKGDPVALNGKRMSPATLFQALNDYGRDNGIGRIDLVENRFVGMKSRGVYETPGGTILLAAHRAIESITLDRGAAHLKDELMPRYAELIYNGFWFSPERRMLQAAIDLSQEKVEGRVRLKLYKGNVIVIGRDSEKSLYSDALVTFEDDRGAYDQKDAAGFIRLNALRLRTLAARDRKTPDRPLACGPAPRRSRPGLVALTSRRRSARARIRCRHSRASRISCACPEATASTSSKIWRPFSSRLTPSMTSPQLMSMSSSIRRYIGVFVASLIEGVGLQP